MKSMLKKIFFKLLGERKKDYIRVILSGIFCISVVFFSTSVGSSLVYISTGRRATMTELVMEVEKNFILPYVLLIFLMILIILGYIRKRSSDYAMLNILGIKKKHRYMYIGCEYLGIILGIVGVIGINTGDFMLQLFLIYFIFLTYRNMPADELFWLNIRKSATRAFILEIILNSVMIILITILEKYNISSAIRISIIRGFGIIFLIALLFFIVMLAWYGKQERKSVEDIYDNNKY